MKNYRYQGIALVHLLSRDSVREGKPTRKLNSKRKF
jgi:hypothetical protein